MTDVSYQLTRNMDVTSGFCRIVKEICVLLELYAA